MRPIVRGEASPPGIVDTLTAGFQAVNRIPWAIAPPVALDLLLWLGPRLAIGRVTDRVLDAVSRIGAPAAASGGASGAEQLAELNRQIDVARAAGQAFNLLSLLGGLLISSALPADRSGTGGSFEIDTLATVAVLAAALLVVGVAIACVWLGLIAQEVRGDRRDVARLGRAVPRYWAAIVGFAVLLFALVLAVGVPLSATTAIAQLTLQVVGGVVGAFAVITIWLLLLWCYLYLFFFTDAVVVSEVGPMRAALNSIRVVSTNFWSTLGFIIITWVIMSGMEVIWASLSRAPVGIVVAILGNGYIESGLAAASMLFYRNRIARLEPRRST